MVLLLQNTIIMSIILLIISILSISYSPQVNTLKKGLIAYYSFNDCKAHNEVGNDGDGIFFGDIDCWCGIEGNALLLDGKDDYIKFPGSLNKAFNIQDFTLSFYIKPADYTGAPTSLFAKRERCNSNQMLDIHFNQATQYFPTYFYESEMRFFKDLSPSSDSSQWIHYVISREGFSAQTYINGVLQQEAFKCRGVDISNEAVFSFSNSPCVYTGRIKRFKGLLDELKIYDRALSSAEVAELYAQHPVDRPNPDCLSFNSKNTPSDLPQKEESVYLCANN